MTLLNIPDSVTSIGDNAFQYCDSLSSVSIGNSVTNIGWGAFYDCTSLTSVSIPDSVTSIGDYAFNNCSSLPSVTIGNSVTSIGNYAFVGCESLTSVLFTGDAPSIKSNAFYSTPATLYYLPAYASSWPSIFDVLPTLCWNPTVQPGAAFGFAADHFGFNISGTTNIPVKVEATTNLASAVWQPVTNATLNSSGLLSVSDPASSSLPARFYRIVFP